MTDATKTLLQATNIALDLLGLATNATTAFQGVSALVQAAQAEGRELTDEDWQKLETLHSQAKQGFLDALKTAEQVQS